MQPIAWPIVTILGHKVRGEKDMDNRSTLTVLAILWVAAGAAACAQPENSCEQLWKNADANDDGMLVGPEDDRYVAYYRIRGTVAPVDGQITRTQFMNTCTYTILKAKAPDHGASPPGASG
jgi:hypothetical protein